MLEQFSGDHYLVSKKFWQLIGGTIFIYGASGELVLYSKLKPFKLREDIRLYTGEDQQTEVLRIMARQIIDFAAVYDVFDSDSGQKIGSLKRKGWKSLLIDEWTIFDSAEQIIGFIKEESPLLAMVRRFLLNLIPQTYNIEIDGKIRGVFKQNFNPFLVKLNVDFSVDSERLLDRRLGLAAAVLLCAIEGKQD